MPDPFAGARLKLVRAEEHFNDLRTSYHTFMQRNPYRALREADTEPHHFVWRIKIVEEPPLDQWGAMVGDTVHCLRSSLDHVAYALVNADKFVSEEACFPIVKKLSSWDGAHPKNLPGVDPKLLAEIEGLQSYHAGETQDILRTIHDLDIIDKHRRIPVVSATLLGTSWSSQGGEVHVTDPCLGAFEDGAVVGRFRIVSEEGAHVSMQTHFAFGIQFGEGIPATGQEVESTLESWRVKIGGLVSSFERFT